MKKKHRHVWQHIEPGVAECRGCGLLFPFLRRRRDSGTDSAWEKGITDPKLLEVLRLCEKYGVRC